MREFSREEGSFFFFGEFCEWTRKLMRIFYNSDMFGKMNVCFNGKLVGLIFFRSTRDNGGLFDDNDQRG